MPNAPLMLALALAGAPASAQTAAPKEIQSAEAQRNYETGHELMKAKSFEQAAASFRTAIELDSQHWLAHCGLGQAEMALKRYPDAVKGYLSCRDAFLHFAHRDLSYQNELERAREDEIRKTRERLHADNATGPGLGLQVQQQDLLRVLEGARLRGKERNFGVPAELMLGLGSAYFHSGQLAEAEAAFRESATIDPKLGPAHNNLAVVYMMSGRFDDSRHEVERAERAGTPVSDSFKKELARRAQEAKAN